MNIFKNITKLAIVVVIGVFTSCGDPMEEITSIDYARVFSPTDFDMYGSAGKDNAVVMWNKSAGATGYVIEIYKDSTTLLSGFPVTLDSLARSYTFEDLEYSTDYFVRLQAIDGNDASRNSKWATLSFTTASVQYLDSVSSVGDRSVVLTWENGAAATRIKIVDSDKNTVVDYTLNETEISNHAATITGLSPETKYTAYLYNGSKLCGTMTFQTLVDLDGATVVYSTQDLKTVIDEAEEGAVLALFGGTYEILSENEDGEMGINAVTISKNISIKGLFSDDKPIVKGRFQMTNGASLELKQIIFDGADNATGDQLINYKDAVETGALTIEGCEIRNFVKGICYVNVAATIESITINDCIIHDITCEGGDFFDCRKGYIKNTTFKNSTFYNIAADRDFIRMDDASGSFTNAAPVIDVEYCTIDNVCYTTAKKRLLYVRFVGNSITWKNTAVSNTLAVWSNQSKTSVPTFSGNVYYNVTNLQTLDPSKDEGGTGSNLFIDESGHIFSSNPYTMSTGQYYTSEAAKGDYGDPRWK